MTLTKSFYFIRYNNSFENIKHSKQRFIVTIDENRNTRLRERFGDVFPTTESLVIIDGALNQVTLVGISTAQTCKGIEQDFQRFHQSLKDLITFCSDLMKESLRKHESFGFTGVLALVNLDRTQFEQIHFCRNDSKRCCEMYLTKDEMEAQDSFNKWQLKVFFYSMVF